MSEQVTVLDGGMGRELLRIGAPFRQPEWSALALWDGPDWVVQAHTNFIEAGAQVVTTNSYALVPFHIGQERFDAEARSLAALSGQLARRAAATSDGVAVAGSLPPLFGSYRPDLFQPAQAASLIDPLVAGLADHVDIWLGETLGSIIEATTVREALDRAGVADRPLWLSFTLDDFRPGHLRSGETVTAAVTTALDLGASAVLFNCCQAEVITAAVDSALTTAAGRAAVGGYANRFAPSHAEDVQANAGIARFRDDLDPPSYCEFVHGWLDRGATLVGGCCGMNPDHIRAIADLVRSRQA